MPPGPWAFRPAKMHTAPMHGECGDQEATEHDASTAGKQEHNPSRASVK